MRETLGGTVDAAELQAIQAPMKDRYRSDPSAALITLRARGTLEDKANAALMWGAPALRMRVVGFGSAESGIGPRPGHRETPRVRPTRLVAVRR